MHQSVYNVPNTSQLTELTIQRYRTTNPPPLAYTQSLLQFIQELHFLYKQPDSASKVAHFIELLGLRVDWQLLDTNHR